MHAIEDEMETIHLYVVREQPKQQYTALPLFGAFLCLLGIAALTLYSAQHPYYEHKRLTVPAILLPPIKTFTAQAPIIPTGVKTYPATYAHGFLTFSNGSVIGQSVPAGFTIDGATTDMAVYVPPATANGFGMSTVSAHLLASGSNMSTLSINDVVGSSLFIRNLSPFTGGKPAYTVNFITLQDRELALIKSRDLLTSLVTGLHYPCSEQIRGALTVIWHCQFVTYTMPPYMHVTATRLSGKNLVVDVWFVPRPAHIWVK